MTIIDLQLQWIWLWGLQMGSSYYVMQFHRKSSKIPFKREITTIEKFMTDSMIHFQLIVVAQIWISLAFPLLIVPDETRYPSIPFIRSDLTFMLHMDTMLVHWPPLLITHNLLNKITTILTFYIPSQGTNFFCDRMTRGYCSRFHDIIRCKQLMFYRSMCYINNRVYYCHVLVRMGSQLNNFFI